MARSIRPQSKLLQPPSTRSARAAVAAGTRLQIAVYGGSALMLASNFRFATEDVDVSRLEQALARMGRGSIVDKLANKNGWAEDWFNDGVVFHLSALADPVDDRSRVQYVSARPRAAGPYWCICPLRRIFSRTQAQGDPRERSGARRTRAARHTQSACGSSGVRTAEEAIALLARYFPNSGASAEKQKFLLTYMNKDGAVDAPEYPRRSD